MPSALTKGKLGLHMKWAKSISEVEEEEEKQKDQKKVKEKGANNNVNDKTDCGSETDAESGHISNAKAQLQLELQAMLANQKQLMSQLKLMAGKLSSTGDGAASVQHMVDHVTSTIINLKKKLKVQV